MGSQIISGRYQERFRGFSAAVLEVFGRTSGGFQKGFKLQKKNSGYLKGDFRGRQCHSGDF